MRRPISRKIMAKVEIAKKISICKCETLLLFDPDTIAGGSSDGKNNSRSNGKKDSHFQMNIFCHLKFCNNRRNRFKLFGL